MKINSRDILIGHISDGIDNTQAGDNSNKSILARGCDPEMGRRAIELLSPILGNLLFAIISAKYGFLLR